MTIAVACLSPGPHLTRPFLGMQTTAPRPSPPCEMVINRHAPACAGLLPIPFPWIIRRAIHSGGLHRVQFSLAIGGMNNLHLLREWQRKTRDTPGLAAEAGSQVDDPFHGCFERGLGELPGA